MLFAKDTERKASLDNQIGVLRSRIEAEVARPSVITVTSANRGDGKSMIANGVAQSMAAAGHRVLVIDAATVGGTSVRGVSEIEDVLRAIRPGDRLEPDTLALVGLTPQGGSFSLQTLRAIFAWCRDRYDYCFVDTRAAHGSPLAMSLAAAADSVIVSVRFGRASSERDRDLAGALKATKAVMLGVVTTNQSAISAFAKRDAQKRNFNDRFTARGVTVKASIVPTESGISR